MKPVRTVPLDPIQCAELVQSERWRTRPSPGSDCLLWAGSVNSKGYGVIKLAGQRQVHRIAYVAANGVDIPPGLVIDHLCNTKCCVNPDHLEVVTQQVNTLRGAGPTATNKQKTHCIKGHALSNDTNTPSRAKKGWRTCLECNRIRRQEMGALIKAAHTKLGLTQRQYVATYGQRRAVAEAVLYGD